MYYIHKMNKCPLRPLQIRPCVKDTEFAHLIQLFGPYDRDENNIFHVDSDCSDEVLAQVSAFLFYGFRL
jgi:hypothetical protein